ncbi:MAG TPA: histidine kinase dimerization/phospho-acceptor domain-containing protein [Gaiellaceae bacterium]|nr:histidine kinase dimerization/phospho-acceptor domain-containing protein [Gaiellaceae bacterium]
MIVRERISFLGEATALLTSSLELDRTLERLTEIAVPLLADWCAIAMLVEETGEIEQLVVAHQDPERKRWAEAMRARSRTIMIDDEFDLTARVIRTAEPVFLREVPQELLDEAMQRDPNAAQALEEISIRSAITVPLRSGERTYGALTLVAESRQLEDSEFELAQELAARAAIAVENARLYREAERRAEAALALAYVGDGVVLLDREGRVRFWNSAAAAITGVREAAAVGRRPSEVVPAWEGLTRLAELADAATPDRARPVTVPIETASGDRWVAVTGVAFDEGVVYALRDVTDEQALERARSDFVATASHELRTPLAAVYGAARTLRRTDIEIPAEQRDRFLEIIVSETERLTAIVSQILLAGQLEEGRVDVSTVETDLGRSPRACSIRRGCARPRTSSCGSSRTGSPPLRSRTRTSSARCSSTSSTTRSSTRRTAAPSWSSSPVGTATCAWPSVTTGSGFRRASRSGSSRSSIGSIQRSRAAWAAAASASSFRASSSPGWAAASPSARSPARGRRSWWICPPLRQISPRAANLETKCSFSWQTTTARCARRSSGRCSCTATRSRSRPTETPRWRRSTRALRTPSSST